MDFWTNVWFIVLNSPCFYGYFMSTPTIEEIRRISGINYVFYPEKMSWNEAQTLCLSIGGNLAKMDSYETKELIYYFADMNLGTNVLKDFWVGLFEMQEGNRIWISDCSTLSYTENIADGWKETEMCFRMDKSRIGKNKKCGDDQAVLCQVPSGTPCHMTSVLVSEQLNPSLITGSAPFVSCSDSCSSTTDCWASISLDPNICYYITAIGSGGWVSAINKTLTMDLKSCGNVTINNTAYVPPEDNSDTPVHSCQSTTSISTTALSTTPTPTTTTTTTTTTTPTTTTTTTPTTTTTATTTSTTSTTTTTTTTARPPPVLICVTLNETITVEEAEAVAEEIVKNLTVNAKKTSAYTRRLTSANDQRPSARFVGYIGVLVVTVPLALLLLSDMKKLFIDCRNYDHIYQ